MEVGAGEGPVAAEVAARTGRPVAALDLFPPSSRREGVSFVVGDALHLPFPPGSFDAVLLHFVLLWLPDPVQALGEIRRVLRRSGALLLLAEPDLCRREDEPKTGLGEALERAVRRAGGHPDAGARAERWLFRAGFCFRLHRTSPHWVTLTDPEETASEIEALLRSGHLGKTEAARLREAERRAAATGFRRVRIPLTYGWAWAETK